MTTQAITDAHVHLWNPEWLRYAWLDSIPALNRPFLPADYCKAHTGLAPAKLIFVEGGCDPAQGLQEVQWVSELARHERRLAGIVAQAAVERGEAVREELTVLARYPLVRGVRRLLQGETDADFCLRPEFVAGVNLLANFKFTFDLCIRHEQLPAVTELVRRCPEVTFVLDHLGKPPVRRGMLDPWRRHLAALAAQPNIACKLSGLTTEADGQRWQPADLRPYLDYGLISFGFDRVLFGSDWPVATLATTCERWLEVVQTAVSSATETDRRQLFQANAERIYRV
jgi:L-fuconolactonase